MSQFDPQTLFNDYDIGERSIKALASQSGISWETAKKYLVRSGRTEKFRPDRAKLTQTSEQQLLFLEIVTGLLLGDGCCQKTGFIEVPQAASRVGWLRYISRLLHQAAVPNRVLGPYLKKPTVIDGLLVKVVEPFFVLKTGQCCELRSIRDVWYPGGRKSLPPQLKLTPLVAALWFCGDGYLQRQGTLAFATHGFSPGEVDRLVQELRDSLGVCSRRAKSTKGTPVIAIGKRDEAYKFSMTVKPYMPRCCLYKVRGIRPSKGRFGRADT